MSEMSLDELVEEVEARARSARGHKDSYESEIARISELLPAIRAIAPREYGPKRLEAMVLGLIERGTISRRTSEVAGTSRKASG